MSFADSITIEKFKIYIDNLRAIYFFDNLCLWFDGLSVHRSKAVRDRLDELGIAFIFNPGYSPDYSGIEAVFSIFKNKIKKERLKAIYHEREINLYELI